jgi:hypothetical protein
MVFIFGPAAVGKMTVGQRLADLTRFKLLYNHMVVDLVTEFFPFGSPPFHALARPITEQIIEACATNGVNLIITHGLLFSAPGSLRLIEEWSAPYQRAGGEIFYAELAAPLDVRLARNMTENRQRHKKVDWATPERLHEMEGWGRWHSDGDLPDPTRHVVIDNTDMRAEDAAMLIKERFGL